MRGSSASAVCLRKNRSESFYYLDRGEYRVAVWQHTPDRKKTRNRAIIICPPVGYEYTHTHRTLRRLAEYLSDLGFYVFRLDYCGSGDSSGSEYCKDSLQLWCDDIVHLAKAVQQMLPDMQQTWLGLRLGATLACLAAQAGITNSLVLWAPLIKGRAYIRELEAISRLAAVPQEHTDDYFECAGFILSRAAADEIKKLNLLKRQPPESIERLLLVIPGEDEKELLEQWGSQSLITACAELEGFEDMMAVPHKTKVPWEAIQKTGEYLETISSLTSAVTPQPVSSAMAQQAVEGAEGSVLEEGVFIGDTNELFAVQSIPAIKDGTPPKGCVLLLNSGSVHHVGPNAIYSQMARQLSGEGFVVLRLDLLNIGDSLVTNPDLENHPYQLGVGDDVDKAVAYLQETFPGVPVAISGVCSGAYHSFQAGLSCSPDKVAQMVMINPLTFYWRSNMSLDLPGEHQLLRKQSGYKKSIKNMEKWKGLFLNPKKAGNALLFVFRRIYKLIVDILMDLWAMAGGSKKPLAKDLESLWTRGIRTVFIFSSRDPGLAIVNSEARWVLRKALANRSGAIYLVEDADHTFSTKASRERLLSLIGTAFVFESSIKGN